jgi:aspartate kinase
MKTRVAKFGGTSVGSLERIRATAERLKHLHAESRVVAVVSAMAGETDRLLALGREVYPGISAAADREMDALVSTGESVCAALLALALQSSGVPACSFTAHQFRMSTDGRFTRARIRSVDGLPLAAALAEGKVCVVTGFQGTDERGNLATLGRGGSDTSAVAIAIALEADCCEIYKDVDGVFTCDPRMVSAASMIQRLSYQEMMELASTGSKVLQIRSVELAMKHGVPLVVRSSFNNKPGTLICEMNDNLEQPLVTALSHDLNQAKVSLSGLPASPESLSVVLEPLARDDISVDFITQNVGADGLMSITFSVEDKLVDRAVLSLHSHLPEGPNPQVERGLAKVTAVGIGMRNHAGVAHRVFSSLTNSNIPIHMALSTEIKVSCLIPAARCQDALQVLHEAFFGTGAC